MPVEGQEQQAQQAQQEQQVPIEDQVPIDEQTQPTESTEVIDNSASLQNVGNGIGLNQNTNNQRTGVYTKAPKPEKTGIEKKINSIRSGLSFHVPSSPHEINRGKNEVMATITGDKKPGFIPSSLISSDIVPKFFYHDFYPQTSISYTLNLPEPDKEKMETLKNQNQNQLQNQPQNQLQNQPQNQLQNQPNINIPQ